MNLALIIILIVAFGYISNWLNWRFLNYKVTHFLYYIGALVHESSHAILCFATGARVHEFNVFSSQPHVTYSNSRLPFIGNLLISSAPIVGGIFFLFLINHYVLLDHFTIMPSIVNLNDILIGPFKLITQIRLFEWQSWVMILLLINVGAMLGPSLRDIKNIWPMLIILFFISSPFFASLGLIALNLIFVNIIIQIILIICIKIISAIKMNNSRESTQINE